MDKPNAPACERNKDAILEVLSNLLPSYSCVLEIGSGTGQHAVYFGTELSDIVWQTSDVAENHNGINMWLDEAQLENVIPPITLDVNSDVPEKTFDAIFTANTCHIMDWPTVQNMLKLVSKCLGPKGMFIIYGPFNIDGKYTSPSNEDFDKTLKSQDPNMGLRDIEAIAQELEAYNIKPIKVAAMPANNFLLVFRAE